MQENLIVHKLILSPASAQSLPCHRSHRAAEENMRKTQRRGPTPATLLQNQKAAVRKRAGRREGKTTYTAGKTDLEGKRDGFWRRVSYRHTHTHTHP